MQKLCVYISDSLNAHHNQAVEATLMEQAKKGYHVVYLWANDNVVFIGKHQNAFLECDINALKQDGGVVARRISGGGAVYHDKGNLNYTFISPKNSYDKGKNFEIITSALNSLGVKATLSGRNDITIDGRKFSGNAFFSDKEVGLHHGTLLIRSDYAKISKYLTVSKTKLSGNNVKSVESRVINLCEVSDEINKELIGKSIILAAKDAFGGETQEIGFEDIDKDKFAFWHKFFCDEKRILGDDKLFDARIVHRFEWGTSDIRIKLRGSIIEDARVYSDALSTEIVEEKEKALIGEDIHNVKNEAARDIICVFVEEKKID
jgi:lipoate-protein ligase A